MLSHALGVVDTVGPPLLVAIGDDTAQPTKQLGEWTPSVSQVVLVLIEVTGGRRSRVGAMPIT